MTRAAAALTSGSSSRAGSRPNTSAKRVLKSLTNTRPSCRLSNSLKRDRSSRMRWGEKKWAPPPMDRVDEIIVAYASCGEARVERRRACPQLYHAPRACAGPYDPTSPAATRQRVGNGAREYHVCGSGKGQQGCAAGAASGEAAWPACCQRGGMRCSQHGRLIDLVTSPRERHRRTSRNLATVHG